VVLMPAQLKVHPHANAREAKEPSLWQISHAAARAATTTWTPYQALPRVKKVELTTATLSSSIAVMGPTRHEVQQEHAWTSWTAQRPATVVPANDPLH
jgi:hypothetical protein